MSHSISRKPVPGAPAATATLAPPIAHISSSRNDTSDDDLSKDIEKSAFSVSRTRVSTEFEEPLPPYHGSSSRRGLGDSLVVEKIKSLRFKKFAFGSGQQGGGGKKIFGIRRRTFVICVVIFVISILALAIRLGVGLKKNKTQNLPLPSNRAIHTGDLTYFAPALGACGITNSDSDAIVAVSHLVFDAVQVGSNPNANPLCGKKIRASRFNEEAGEQRSVDLTVTDRCTGCAPTDIDVTISVFDQLAVRDHGRVLTEWAWLDVDM